MTEQRPEPGSDDQLTAEQRAKIDERRDEDAERVATEEEKTAAQPVDEG